VRACVRACVCVCVCVGGGGGWLDGWMEGNTIKMDVSTILYWNPLLKLTNCIFFQF